MGIAIVLGIVFVIIFGIVFLLLFSVNSAVDKTLEKQKKKAEETLSPPKPIPNVNSEQQPSPPDIEKRENSTIQNNIESTHNTNQPQPGSSFGLGMGIITFIIAFIIVFMLVNSMHFH